MSDPRDGKWIDRPAQKPLIIESFKWLTPQFHAVDSGPHQVKIKGVAVKSGTVSRNNRKYIDEELIKSARTMIGRPLTRDHDMNQIIGNVEWAEYEDGALEYLAVVKKEPYVTMIRNKDPKIRGVSIEAKYLDNLCVRCGARFDSEKAFQNHMQSEHHIIDGITAPHGLVYDALSLIISPEQPGIGDTSLEVFESTSGQYQLFETILRCKGVETNMEKEKQLGEPCSPELRKCVDDLIAQGKPEESAWAICKSQLGEKITVHPISAQVVKASDLVKETEEALQKYKDVTTKNIQDLTGLVVAQGKQIETLETKIHSLESKPIKESVDTTVKKDIENLKEWVDTLRLHVKPNFKVTVQDPTKQGNQAVSEAVKKYS
jgi:hypothetical protein